MNELQVEGEFRTAVNSAIAGFLYRKGDIEEIPRILRAMADDYANSIDEERDN